MNRSIQLVLALALATLAGVGCGKKESTPADIPVPSGTPAPVASGPTDNTAAPPVAPPVVTTPVVHASIDACCSALSAIEHSGKDAIAKKKAASAARVCPGIASRVKAGQVPRGEAIAQIVSALAGMSVPGECH